jgi:hypothetical protein
MDDSRSTEEKYQFPRCRICCEFRSRIQFSQVEELRSNVKYCCSVKNADGKSCIEIEKARIERSRAAGRRLLIDKLK